MTKKRTVNDTEQPRLRRSLTGSQEYQNETYHTELLRPGIFDTDGTLTNLSGRFEAVLFAGGADKWVRGGNLIIPASWKKGKLTVDTWWRVNNGTAGNFDIEYKSSYQEITTTTVTSVINDNEQFANPGSGANDSFTRSTTSDTITLPSVNDLILGLQVRRIGATGSDTAGATSLYFLAARYTWLPETFKV